MININTVTKTINKRNSNIEILRIIAMLFIIMSHSSVHSEYPDINSDFILNNFFLDSFILGNLGVCVFTIISGYFMYNKPFRGKSLIKLYAQVWFYSVVGFLISLIIDPSFSLHNIRISFFPFISGSYWFFSAYIILMIFAPFFNILIDNLSKKSMAALISFATLIWLIIPSITFFKIDLFSSKIIFMFIYYFIGAYLKKYPDNIFNKKNYRYIFTAVSFILLFLSSTVLRYINNILGYNLCSNTLFYNRSSILILLCGISLFSIFLYNKPFTNNFINTVGSCTFGVYLIHDNNFIRPILWKELLNPAKLYNSKFLIPYLILCIITIFIICSVIEFLRQKTIGKPINNLFLKLYSFLKRIIFTDKIKTFTNKYLNE